MDKAMVERIVLFKLKDEYSNAASRAEFAHRTRADLSALDNVRAVIDTLDKWAEQLRAATEGNGSEYEAIKTWVPNPAEEGVYSTGGKWEVTGYDETKPLADRWMGSKAEKKRFAAWLKEQEGTA